jgi:hypothetical protein
VAGTIPGQTLDRERHGHVRSKPSITASPTSSRASAEPNAPTTSRALGDLKVLRSTSNRWVRMYLFSDADGGVHVACVLAGAGLSPPRRQRRCDRAWASLPRTRTAQLPDRRNDGAGHGPALACCRAGTRREPGNHSHRAPAAAGIVVALYDQGSRSHPTGASSLRCGACARRGIPHVTAPSTWARLEKCLRRHPHHTYTHFLNKCVVVMIEGRSGNLGSGAGKTMPGAKVASKPTIRGQVVATSCDPRNAVALAHR